MSTTEPAPQPAVRWHATLPNPQITVPFIQPAALAEIIASDNLEAGKDYLIVDVRRTDFETASVKGALNLPAHSFYQTLSTIVTLLSPIPKVIFHCNSCSEGGRGPRTAGWYADELKKTGKGNLDGVLVLEGGLKAWLAAYGDDESLTTKLPDLMGS